MFDYLIVGSGLFGSTFARLMTDQGKKCLVLEKRDHIGGNCYTHNVEGINVHKYGAHIFHTSNEKVWEFVNRFASFNNYINSPVANFAGKLYSLPFNMYTFNQIWGVLTPEEARNKLNEEKIKLPQAAQNLEEQALSMVGRDIYEILIKGYTYKQWMKDPKELPASIIKRLPLRFTFDNNYFNDRYQGIPIGGYTNLFENMLSGIEVKCGVDYLSSRGYLNELARRIVYTGRIDEFYSYEFGELEYRTLRFENELLATDNFQGNAVVNYTSIDVPYTRIIEHKHFERLDTKLTYITREYPEMWSRDRIPYYPINDQSNMEIFNRYQEKSRGDGRYIFGGRLAEYKYYDMHAVIGSAMLAVQKELLKEET
ncbi:MAG: UDP-galactopyranose mutase [Elainellaceae cyanobacterium]